MLRLLTFLVVKQVGSITFPEQEGLLEVCAGLLGTGHAKEQALQGPTSELSASGKKLVELGCKKEHLGSLCRGLAHSRNEPECCVENRVCKGGRRCATFGFFAKF
jgi:hypothetical protein